MGLPQAAYVSSKAALLARMNIIEQLQTSRPEIVHLFDELVRTIPEGVHLSSLSQNGAALELKGVAQSSARVSAYMRAQREFLRAQQVSPAAEEAP